MSGCYRCGLPEGSSERLCETCYRLRFHRGLEIVEADSAERVEGLELSPRANGAVVAGGAVVYAVVVGFFSATMGRPLLPVEQPRFELILDKEASQAIDHNQSFGPVVIPERVINEKKVDKEGSSKSK